MLQNRFLCSLILVSDDIITDSGYTNKGATLPSSKSATHNAGLSPLFLSRGGYKRPAEQNITDSGSVVSFISNTVKNANYAHYAGHSTAIIAPSMYNLRTYSQSLRCLVSTNNG